MITFSPAASVEIWREILPCLDVLATRHHMEGLRGVISGRCERQPVACHWWVNAALCHSAKSVQPGLNGELIGTGRCFSP